MEQLSPSPPSLLLFLLLLLLPPALYFPLVNLAPISNFFFLFHFRYRQRCQIHWFLSCFNTRNKSDTFLLQLRTGIKDKSTHDILQDGRLKTNRQHVEFQRCRSNPFSCSNHCENQSWNQSGGGEKWKAGGREGRREGGRADGRTGGRAGKGGGGGGRVQVAEWVVEYPELERASRKANNTSYENEETTNQIIKPTAAVAAAVVFLIHPHFLSYKNTRK